MKRFILLAACLLFGHYSDLPLNAQTIPAQNRSKEKGKKSPIKWLDAKEVRVVTEGDRRIHFLKDNVQLRQDSMYFFADNSVLQQNHLFASDNVIIVQGDSLNIFGDTLNYDGNTRYGYLTGQSIIDQKGSLLHSQFLEYDAERNLAYYQKGAVLTDGEFQLTSKRGFYDLNLERIIFRDSVVILGEDFLLKTDSLVYDLTQSRADFIAPTLIQQEHSKIYTEGGYYYLASGNAVLFNNPQYTTEEEFSRADTMIFDREKDLLLLRENTYYIKDSLEINSRYITYNLKTEKVDIVGNALVVDGPRVLTSQHIVYDLQTGQFNTLGRAKLIEENYEIASDSFFYDEETGMGFAIGGVEWKDLKSGMYLESEQAEFLDSNGLIKAYGGRPWIMHPSEKDTLYLSADTILSRQYVILLDTQRQTHAYHNVKIFKKDFQAICDSLAHIEGDSMFRMVYDPIIWTDTTQLTGDTIDVQMANGNLSSAFIRENAMVINSSDSILFNQMKGRQIHSKFKDGNLSEVRIFGNAQSLYFPKDETGAYMGMDKRECAEIKLQLEDDEVKHIRFYNTPTGAFTPMKKAKEEQFKLEGFQWRGNLRPNSFEDIIRIAQPVEAEKFIGMDEIKAETSKSEEIKEADQAKSNR